MLLRTAVFFALASAATGANEFLRRQSFAYGVAWVSSSQEYNSTCAKDLRTFLEAADQRHVWALKVLDASGRPSSGFLWGNNLWVGSETECYNAMNRKPLEINYKKVKHYGPTPFDYSPFNLDFVMARMNHNSTLQQHAQMPLETLIQLGLCVPNSCGVEELRELLRRYLDSGHFSFQKFYNISIEIEEINSIWKNPRQWLVLPKTIVLLTICFLTLLLVVVGTIYDAKISQPPLKKKEKKMENTSSKNGIYTIGNGDIKASVQTTTDNGTKQTHTTPSFLGQVFLCFSFNSNMKALWKIKTAHDTIQFLHGFRLLSMLWVISIHAIFFSAGFVDNAPDAFRIAEEFITQPFNNSTYAVDSFLFLSGFLLSYIFYKSKKGIIEAKKPINYTAKFLEYISFIMNRFLRLTPPYMVCIIITDVITTRLRQYSILYPPEMNDEVCPKYWWRNLLYINNLWPRKEMCLSWSYYLSLDMQFFCIMSFLAILSTIYFKTTAVISVGLILTGLFSLGVASYRAEYVPTMDEQYSALDAVYDLPWQRIGPYVVGFVVGYLLVVKLEWKLKISKRLKTMCWIIFPVLNLYIIFGIWGRNLSVEYAAFYMGFSRTFWGVGVGWLFIACCTNNAGIINKILSFRGWVPFSRLTYCAYLLNPLIMQVIYSTSGVQHISLPGMVYSCFGMIILTFFFSMWFSIFFEVPYMRLTKLILRNSKNDRKTTEEGKSNDVV